MLLTSHEYDYASVHQSSLRHLTYVLVGCLARQAAIKLPRSYQVNGGCDINVSILPAACIGHAAPINWFWFPAAAHPRARFASGLAMSPSLWQPSSHPAGVRESNHISQQHGWALKRTDHGSDKYALSTFSCAASKLQSPFELQLSAVGLPASHLTSITGALKALHPLCKYTHRHSSRPSWRQTSAEGSSLFWVMFQRWIGSLAFPASFCTCADRELFTCAFPGLALLVGAKWV